MPPSVLACDVGTGIAVPAGRTTRGVLVDVSLCMDEHAAAWAQERMVASAAGLKSASTRLSRKWSVARSSGAASSGEYAGHRAIGMYVVGTERDRELTG